MGFSPSNGSGPPLGCLFGLNLMEINFADLPKAIRLRARSVGPTGERWVATLEETVSSLALKW